MSPEDLKKTIDELNARFGKPSREPNRPILPIKLLNDEVTFRMHWVGGSSLKQMASCTLRVDAFPKCPGCGAECCHGHPRNSCELRDVYDVSES